MAELDIRSQDPDDGGLAAIGVLFAILGVPLLLLAAWSPPSASLLDEQTRLLFGLSLAVVGVTAMAVGFSSADLRREPQEDGSLHLSRRGVAGLSVVFLGLVAATAIVNLAAAGLTRTSWPLALCALLAGAGFARQYLAWATHVSLHISPGEPRPGHAVAVRWRVSAPLRVTCPRAVLVAEERAHRDRVDVTRLHELAVAGDGSVTIPAAAMPTLLGSSHAIAWRIELAADMSLGPGFSMSLPLLVRGAVDRGAPRDDAPASPPASPGPAITLRGGHHAFAPGEPIVGEIGWDRTTAPRRAVVRLVWQSRPLRGAREQREVVARISVSRLPQVAAHGSDDPYRGAGESEETGVPLGASERRRVQLTAPEAPPSYRGALFEIDWWLEIEVDDHPVVLVPLVIGPGRAALTCPIATAPMDMSVSPSDPPAPAPPL